MLDNILETIEPDLIPEFEAELRRGWHQEEVSAAVTQKQLSPVSNREAKSLNGVGRLRMTVDPASFHYWGLRLGYDCWKDRQFLDEYERDNPECKIKCKGTKIQMGYKRAVRETVNYG